MVTTKREENQLIDERKGRWSYSERFEKSPHATVESLFLRSRLTSANMLVHMTIATINSPIYISFKNVTVLNIFAGKTTLFLLCFLYRYRISQLNKFTSRV